MSGALPVEMAPVQTPNAAAARAVRMTALPVNAQTFNSGDLIRINVPRRPGSFLIPSQSFLRFDVVIANGLSTSSTTGLDASGSIATTGSAGLIFDGHCSSVINTMTTYHGSTVLEQTLGYNRLYAAYLDAQLPREQRNGEGAYSIAGGANDTRGASGATFDASGATVGTYPGPSAWANANQIMTSQSTQLASTYTYTMPLISSVFGAGQNGGRYFPLDRLNDGLTLELQLESFQNATKLMVQASSTAQWTADQSTNVAATAACMSIRNVSLVCQLVELDSEAMSAYNRMHPGEIVLPVTQYRGYQSTLAYPLSANSALVPARFQSVNALIWGMFDQANLNDFSKGSITWRSRANLSTVQYRIGSLSYPSKPIDCWGTAAEVYMEFEKAFRSAGAINGSVSFTKDEFVLDTGAGAFLGAQELSVFPHAQGTTFAGVSTIGQNIFLDQIFGSAGMSNSTYALWVWAQYDAKIIIDETGSARVVY